MTKRGGEKKRSYTVLKAPLPKTSLYCSRRRKWTIINHYSKEFEQSKHKERPATDGLISILLVIGNCHLLWQQLLLLKMGCRESSSTLSPQDNHMDNDTTKKCLSSAIVSTHKNTFYSNNILTYKERATALMYSGVSPSLKSWSLRKKRMQWSNERQTTIMIECKRHLILRKCASYPTLTTNQWKLQNYGLTTNLKAYHMADMKFYQLIRTLTTRKHTEATFVHHRTA